MKKILALVLALIMVLSLCACGQKAVEPEVTAEPSAEPVAESGPEVAEEKRVIEKVEINADNFLDYFDYVVEADYDNATKNADGKITALTICYNYVLKPEYEAAWEQAKELDPVDFTALLEGDEEAIKAYEEQQDAESPVMGDFTVVYEDILNPTGVDYEKLSFADCEDRTEQSFSTSIQANWWHENGELLVEGDSYDDASYKMTVLEFTWGVETLQELKNITIDSASGILFLYK